jgi:type IV fimbrial biogenesis protein FimT
MRQKNIRGFTIPEVMITLGVAAIILTTAIPSLSTSIKDNRLATRVNEVITDIHFARSEAAKRDVRVVLCRSNNPNASSPACSTDTSHDYTWTGGYLIFADSGTAPNGIYDAGTDVLLHRGQPAISGVNMRTNANWNRNLEFNPNGSLHEGGVGIMSICDDRDKEEGRQIVVSLSGAAKLYSDNISTCAPSTL